VLATAFWPGPLTLALAADARYAAPVRSAGGTVAIRDTPHSPLRRLLQHVGEPLTSTSANLAGELPARSLGELRHVLRRLPGGAEVLILDGGSLPASEPSTLVDCSDERPRLVRDGALPLAALRSALHEQGFAIDVG
jgi:L-threonylcarbamoyladenylate synthase